MSLIHYTSRQESVLRKKRNSVCYHAVCESVAKGKSLVEYIRSKENFTYVMTKVFYGQKSIGTWPAIFFIAISNLIS